MILKLRLYLPTLDSITFNTTENFKFLDTNISSIEIEPSQGLGINHYNR